MFSISLFLWKAGITKHPLSPPPRLEQMVQGRGGKGQGGKAGVGAGPKRSGSGIEGITVDCR